MPRKIAFLLAFAAAVAGLVWAGWPGAPSNPATVTNRADVIATVALLAGLPWITRWIFGPAGGVLAQLVRAAGYLIVFALVLVKTAVARLEDAAPAERHVLAGLWAGEVLFLILLAAYVTGLLAVTARRPPAAPAALGIGVRAGAACGLVFYVLPPIGHPLHLGNIWLAGGYGVARVLASLAVLCALAAAGVAAGRRTSARGGRLPLADARARQGVAAGVCAGVIAAVLVSLLGVSTIALLPQEAGRLTWTLPNRHTLPGDVYNFEVGASDSAAGYLAVLVFFPLFGAGLGAWGGLYAAGQPRRRPGGGGGGGPSPVPPPPGQDGPRDAGRLPALLRGGYLRELPVTEGLSPAPEQEPAAPVATRAHALGTRHRALNCGDGREPGPASG
jgi:hypothetical protein